MASVVSDNQSRTLLHSVFVSKLLRENYSAVFSNFDGHARHRHKRCEMTNKRFLPKSRSNVKGINCFANESRSGRARELLWVS